jgi:predicted dehydrogenase
VVDKKVRLGIIGCGVIGKQHMKAAMEADWIELAGVADVNPEAAQLAAEQFGAQQVYPNADLLLEDSSIEAVVLAVPTNIRTAIALKALANGKHVLLEKPVALHEKEVRQLIEAQGELTVAVCSSRFRFLEHADAARRWIEEGNLGEVRILRCRVNEPAGKRPAAPPPAWRLHTAINGGGIVANWGIYDFDYLLGLTGWTLQPKWVLSHLWQLPEPIADYFPPNSDSETYGSAFIQCENGTVITFERGEFMAAPLERSWQIIGSKGSLTLHMTWPSEKTILCTTLDAESGAQTRTLWEGTEDSSWVDKGPVIDFTRSILDGSKPATGLQEALVLQQILDAVYQSARSGAPVQISSDRGTEPS